SALEADQARWGDVAIMRRPNARAVPAATHPAAHEPAERRRTRAEAPTQPADGQRLALAPRCNGAAREQRSRDAFRARSTVATKRCAFRARNGLTIASTGSPDRTAYTSALATSGNETTRTAP